MSSPVSIGLVVPNFNGERFLAATLNSIARQDYKHLRCLVMDGGSRDASVQIAREFSRKYPAIEVVSEPDEGQADAIEKGMRRLDTELVGWLNSDDLLLPGTLESMAARRAQQPEASLFYGDLELCDEEGRLFSIIRAPDFDYDALRGGRGQILQPGSFYARELLQRAGGVRKEFWGLMDLDLWIRLLQQGPAVRLRRRVAQFRIHPAAKSGEQPLRYYREVVRVMWRYNPERRAKVLLPKLRGIPVHFARWLFDVNVNAYQAPPPISSPPHIEVEGALMPSLVAQQLQSDKEFAGAFSSSGRDDADIRFMHPETLLNLPRRRRINQSAPQVPVVIAAPHLTARQAAELTSLRAPLAFVLTGPEARQLLIESGFPEFRIGERTRTEDWQRALRVASGELFAP